MKKRIFFVMVVACAFLFSPGKASALILINEFLADPPSDISGDTNGDGVRHSSNDEFVELYNTGASTVDLSGWKLSDNSAVRHVFTGASLFLPNTRWVVFGGGALGTFPFAAFTASTGTLHLNNTGDQIILTDNLGYAIDSVTYGSEAGMDQSLTRFPEGSWPFKKHTTVSSIGLPFSPGRDVEGHLSVPAAAIPEPSGILIFSLLAGLVGRKILPAM